MTTTTTTKILPDQITRGNVDIMIDAGLIETKMPSGKFWKIRRNARTRRFKRDVARIVIPYKYGLHGYGKITEKDFVEIDGVLILNPEFYRVVRVAR